MPIHTFSLSRRSLRAHPLRSALIILAVTLATGVLLAASIVIDASNRSASARERPAPELEVRPRLGDHLDSAAATHALEDSAVRLVLPVVEAQAHVPGAASSDPAWAELAVLGSSLPEYAPLHGYTLLDGRWPKPDELGTVISTRLAARLGLQAGDTFELENSGRLLTFAITGRYTEPKETGVVLANLPGPGPLLVSYETARDLAGLPEGQAAYLEIDLQPGYSPEQTRTRLLEQLGPDLVVAQKALPRVTEPSALLVQAGLWISGGLLGLAAAFVIFNAFSLTLAARKHELSALRAIGMTRRQMLMMVLSEAAWLGGLGALVGLVSGPLLAWGLMQSMRTMNELPFWLPWWGVLLALVLGPGTALASALLPAWQAARTSPLTAIGQGSAESSSPRPPASRWAALLPFLLGPGILALTMAAGGFISWATRPDLFTLFGIIGLAILGVLAGGILMLPPLVGTLAGLLERLQTRLGVPAGLAGGSLSRGRSRAALTAAGMLVGLSALLGTRGITYYWFDLAMTPIIALNHEDRTIGPDLLQLLKSGTVSLENGSVSGLFNQPQPPGMMPALEGLQREGLIELIRYQHIPMPVELQTQPAFGLLSADIEPYLRTGSFDFYEGDPVTALARMRQGRAVLVLPMIAARFHLKVGDTLTIPTSRGDIPFEVVGIGGNQMNMNTISFEDGCFYFNVCKSGYFGVIVAKSAPREAVLDRLDRVMAEYPGWKAMDSKKNLYEAFILFNDQINQMMNSMLVLIVLLSGFGIANTITMSVAERSRELGLLRAVGATRSQVRRSVIYEAAGLGLLAALLSILIGLLMLASMVIILLPTGLDSIGLRLNAASYQAAWIKTLPGLATASLLALIVAPLVAAVAAYFPARRAAEADPAAAARSEAMPLGYRPQPRQESRPALPRSATLTLALRNLIRQRTRSLLSAFAVAVGVAAMVAAWQVSAGIQASFTNRGSPTDALSWVVDLIGISLSAGGVVLLLAAAALVHNAFAMMVTQRSQEIGSLRSLGMARGQVVQMVVLEAALTGCLGALLGLAIGPALGQLLSWMLTTHSGSASLPMWNFLVAAGLGLLTAGFAAWGPARRAAQISPLEAIRGSDPAEAGGPRPARNANRPPFRGAARRPLRRRTTGVLVLLLLWAGLSIAPPGSWLGQPYDMPAAGILVMVWLVGLWLLLPTLAVLPALLLRKSRGAVARLAAAGAARNPQRLAIDVFSFAVGVAAIGSLNGILYFQNHVLLRNMSQSMIDRAGLIVQSIDTTKSLTHSDLSAGQKPFTPQILAQIRLVVGDRAQIYINDLINVPEMSVLSGLPVPSIMTDLSRLSENEFNFVEGDWPSARQWIAEGCAVLMPKSAADRQGVHPGDFLHIHGTVQGLDCRVVGVGAGGASPFGLISLHAQAAYGLKEPSNLQLVPRPGTDTDQLKADLLDLNARYPGQVFVQDGRELLEGIFNTSDAMLSSMNALLLLGVIIATLGVFNTTLIGVTERRRELGLLRSIGATRRQALAQLALEAGLTGLTGGVLGLAAGVGATMVFALVVGGSQFGITDLPLWPSAWESGLAAAQTGVIGVLGGALLSPLAAWVAARPALRRSPVEILSPSTTASIAARAGGWFGWTQRGSLRARLMFGVASLLTVVMATMMTFVVMHARFRLEEQIAAGAAAMASLNARMLEAAVPKGSQNLSLEILSGDDRPGGATLDAASLLDMQSVFKRLQEEFFNEYRVVDRSGLVIASLDAGEMGAVLKNSVTGEVQTRVMRSDATPHVLAVAPIRNSEGEVIGSAQIGFRLESIDASLNQLGLVLAGVSAVLIGLGLLLAWLISTPLIGMTQDLTAHAALARQGIYQPVVLPNGLRARISARFTLQMRILILMVGLVAFLLVATEMIAIPSQRQEFERLAQNLLVGMMDWSSDAISEMIGTVDLTKGASTELSRSVRIPPNRILEEVLKQDFTQQNQTQLNLASLQEFSDFSRSGDVAYMNLADINGQVLFSDQIAQVGRQVAVVDKTSSQASTYRDRAVWVVSAPIYDGKGGPQIGLMQLAWYQASAVKFIDESRMLLRLFGLAALLAATLLAQGISGTLAVPVRQMAASARQVAQGNLDTRFQPDGASNELLTLAQTYNEMITGLREREWLRDMFGRFVSQEVAEAIRSGQVKLQGENRVVSILFCDIRGFTTRSERVAPEHVVALLNEYLPIVVESAQKHNGTVNKFGGDSTLILYGAPRPLAESAYQAIQTAIEMRSRLANLNQRLTARGEEPIHIGVGINTGMVVAGAVGPASRQEYTVIGDTVNLAARIEALNKEYSQYDILISDQTRQALGVRAGEFEMTSLGILDIRGKSEPVQVWAVVNRGR